MGIPEAQKALEQARAAYKAHPEDKALKKAMKAAKASLVAEQAKPQEALPSSKKRKGDEASAETAAAEVPKKQKKKRTQSEKSAAQLIEDLRTAVANAKTAYKAEKTPENKKKLKEAKTAVKAAEAAQQTPAAPPAPPATPSAAPATDVLAGLKSNKQQSEGAESKDTTQGEASNRVFVGNLSYTIDDDGIKKFFADCGTITKILWIEDRATKRFKGCGVLDFDSLESAAKAVAKDGETLLGRPISCQYPKDKPKDPKIDDKQRQFVEAPLAPKPEGCITCFVGNLSFSIEEDDIRDLAKDCGEITSIRWTYHKDSGDFKGCGFVDFATTEAVDKFVQKRGSVVKGRPVRIDYSTSRRF